MRRPDEKSTTRPSAGPAGERPNAFTAELFDELREREPEPPVPEASNAGPWRVLRLHGAGEPLWACHAAGEAGPRMTFDAPDLAHMAAATLAVSERPPRFRFETGADGRLRLLEDGHPVATAEVKAEAFPLDLTRLADLRAQPLPLAQFLVSVPQDVLRRAGTLMMEILRDFRS